MSESILVAGKPTFNEKVVQRFVNTNYALTTQEIEQNPILPNLLEGFERPIQNADTVFINVEPNYLPVAELALKQGKHVILFGVQFCTKDQLISLLNLALESKSLLLNGDSLLFNPIIFEARHYFISTEITTLSSNRFSLPLSKRSIFNCIELLLFANPSPVKSVSAKVVRLKGKKINVLHTRLEFENGDLAVLEMTNIRPQTTLNIETAGKGTWLSLDLLSFNGRKHKIDNTTKLLPPEQIYPKERNAMVNLLYFVENELPTKINPHYQFYNTIRTAEVILKMEEQLRREVPNFVRFTHE